MTAIRSACHRAPVTELGAPRHWLASSNWGRHRVRYRPRPCVSLCGVRGSGRADPSRLRSLEGLLDLEIDPLALFERLVARSADRGIVHEDVARAVIRGDEAVALLRVE